MEAPFTDRPFLLPEEACRERALKAMEHSWTPLANKAVIVFSVGMPVIVMLLAMADHKIPALSAIFITALFTIFMLLCLSIFLLILPDRAALIQKIRNGKGIVAILPYESMFLSNWVSQQVKPKNGEQMTRRHDGLSGQFDVAGNLFNDAFEQLTGDSPDGFSWKGLVLILLMGTAFPPIVAFSLGGTAVVSRLCNLFLGNKNRPRIFPEPNNFVVIHEEGVYFGGTMYSFSKPAIIRHFSPEKPSSSPIRCKLITYREPWIMRFSGWGGFELLIPIPDSFQKRSLEIEADFKHRQIECSSAELPPK